jgi:hypothetical protein
MGHPQACLVVLSVLAVLAISAVLARISWAQDRGPGGADRPEAAAEGGRAAGAPAEGAAPRRRRRFRQPDAGRLIADAIAPIDEMIRQNGFAFRASHFAEDCRDWPASGCAYYQAHAGRFAFAIEAAGGRATEYCLCAARGPDGVCALYVSVCEYGVVDEPREGGGVLHRIVIDQIRLVKPDALSLKLRAEMMDELSQGNFLGAYRAHVREHPDGTPPDAVIRPWMGTGGTEET